jgi:hypothetical protein
MKRSKLLAALTLTLAALGSFAVALPASAAPTQHHKRHHKHKHHHHHAHNGHHVNQGR